jgi:hypothetical protein
MVLALDGSGLEADFEERKRDRRRKEVVDTLLLLLGATPAAEAWSLEAEVAGEEGVEEEGESVTDLDRSWVDTFCENIKSLEDGGE